MLVLDHYVDAFKAQRIQRDLINYRLQMFKDQTNQAISHLLHGKVFTFAIVILLLSCFSLGKKTLQLLSWVRFGR